MKHIPTLVMLLLGALLLCGCGDCSWSSRSVGVILNRSVPVRLPAPVLLDNTPIGKVVKIEEDGSGRSLLTLCLDDMDRLTSYTAFYLESSSVEDVLVCEILAPGALPEDKELLFPGFADYASFFAWRAETMLQQGMEDMLRAIENAIGQ